LKKRYIFVPLLIVGTLGVALDGAAYALSGASLLRPDGDTVKSRYPVRPTTPDGVADLENPGVADLKNPENIKQEVEYDYKNNRYVVHTKLGDEEIGNAIPMTEGEYMSYTERALRAAYFREQYRKAYEEADGKGFDLMDMQFSLGPAEKIFGKGGIRVKTQGSGSLSFGYKKTVVDNPTLSQQARTQKSFDFDMTFQLNANASIGSKMNFNLNYNTEATFDFDANQLKLAYDGEEDEIIQHLEAGNVSMTTGSSLITGGSSLFGIKTALKFGKLNITALLAKQESSTKTVSSKGGATTRTFEIPVDEYDENRHFFLAHYFRDTYDQNMAHLPLIASGVEITKIEVWVTNKRGTYDNARNVVAFMDLAETDHRSTDYWYLTGSSNLPENKANSLYEEVTTSYAAIRDITNVTTTLTPLESYGISGGKDFEKVESARLLSSSEYTLNSQLGYISLKSKLDDDMMLAVAYQYTKGGRTYQVGEFSTDNSSDTQRTLVVKLLKGTSGNPNIPLWDLMMKNVYSLGVTSLQKTNFTLQVQYMSDSVGVYTNYINEGPIAQQLLVKVMNLDRLNANNESHSDGKFDYVEGYTVQSSSGRIIFPVVEPFGSHLAAQLGSEALAQKYCYQELYDSTLTVAEQVAEKNKFRLKGEYTASVGSEIDLGAMNVARGSVVVTAGGATLVENTDYTVDYTMGIVTILNESIIESGTAVSVSLEDQSTYSLQRKTMMGLDLQYDYSKDLQFGATVMNLHEKPLTQKVSMSEIPINNTIYGFNLKWNKDFMWLTNAVGSIPWVTATAPSNFSLSAEYAQLVAGHSSQIGTDGNVLLDDFESSETPTDISTPTAWQLCSTPYDDGAGALFPEASLSNDVSYGKNRALFSWYVIDRLFTSQSSSLTPGHIKNDLEQLSDHRVRQVYYDEIYPNKQLTYGETGILNVLNLSFYPEERGPYNVDVTDIDANGKLLNPEKRWGGMMRAMDVTNFENANYEYIEFWMMDPFIDDADGTNEGGDLYFNLGEVSEDILKDGMKSFENGLSVDGDTLNTTRTVWGRVSRRSSTVYAFDNSTGSRKQQDVGLDGLTDEAEQQFPTYKNYVEQLQSKVSGETLAAWSADPFSPLNDPAGDNFHHYRGSDFDRAGTSILERYKHYTGTDGNSASTSDSPESYSTASQSTPDVEDINKDNTLNEYERYYQYHISIRPEDMAVGRNCIEAVSETRTSLRNGKSATVKWYQFRIPLHEYDKKVGTISNFKSIRFMRVFMTGWKQAQTLRLATLELVRSDWRTYTASSLADRGYAVAGTGELSTSTVNIEENAGSIPVNYVLSPGVTRINDPSQSTATQLNEQAMVLAVSDLEPHDAVAVYKNSGVDIRNFENLQLFVHAEALVGNETGVGNNDLSVFVRLGSDYKDNYYEYEVPLRLTPAGTYNNNSSSDRLAVWPKENMIDVAIKKFTALKKERNTLKQQSLSNVSYTSVYTTYDDDNRNNRISIIGNPTLSEVSVIMIGVRNNSKTTKSARIWVNELRMNGIDESGGWAAKGNATLRVSDLATFNMAGAYTSAGFGSIEQSSTERQLSNDYNYTFSGQTDVGRWVPEQLKLTAPVYYSRAKSVSTPKYDPYNEDMLLEETLDTYGSKHEKDSIRELTQTVDETTSFSVSGLKFNVKSKKAKPWDPANVTMSYSQNKNVSHDPTTEYEHRYTWKGSINYNYTPYFVPWTPFKAQTSGNKTAGNKPAGTKGGDDKKSNGNDGKKKASTPKILSEFQLNWLPNSISLSSNINRTYQEEQLREVSSQGVSDYQMPVSYSSTFTWLRQTAIAWDVTKTLKLNFNSATNARIDEPDGPVNKELYPDEYQQWKDTIMTQLWKLGTPTAYNQTFDGTWNAPISKIPGLDWTNLSVKYKSSYAWNRGTQIDESTMTGNSLQNEATWQWDGRLNFETLYNKSKFLKKTNDKFRQTNKNNGKNSKSKTTKKAAEKKTSKKVTLAGDSVVTVRHGLNTRRLIISAKGPDGKSYPLKYRATDANNIRIKNHDSIDLVLTIKADKPLDDEGWYKSLQYTSRALMMVRSATIGYRSTQSTYLPSFKPFAGDFFGQNNGTTAGGLAPGLGFAFGFDGGESFTEKAIANDWLICNDSLTTPAVYNSTRDLTYQFVVEPLTGLKINLNGLHKRSEKQSHQFMFEDMAITKSGSFQMTTIALGSSFGNKLSGSYQSGAFSKFLANREVIYNRFLAQYEGTKYPTGGFMSSYSQQAGTPFAGNLGASRINSSDVLVPAFLAAYTGGDAASISLSPFPKIWKALPNWKVTYDGLMALFPGLSKYFKNVTLSHAYTCTYNVGSYATYTNYAENEGRLGFTLDAANDVPVPASEFDISTVSLSESFAPLAGISATTLNGITVKGEFKQTRTVTLNMSAAQIVENISRDLTVGLGYKITDFSTRIGLPTGNTVGVNHDLNLRLDVTHKNTVALLRRIEGEYSEATSGNKAWTIKFAADYQLSKMLSLRLYYDKQINTPLISTSYPTINTDFGITMNFSLNR
jgi:cell surface protein SprA